MSKDDKIQCEICFAQVHSIEKHLKEQHPAVSLESYQRDYPDAPIMSEKLKEAVAERARDRTQQERKMAGLVASIIPQSDPNKVTRLPLHEAFEMPLTEGLRSPPKKGKTEGDAIMVNVFDRDKLDPADVEAVPDVDDGYVFREEELKDALMAIQLGMPLLAWGYHGAGKTTLIEQICARTCRPWVRIQHTDTTEEAHIIGQMAVRDGGTVFDYGPLAEAMMRGWVYCADEYDFALPAVIAVYQAVLEGKPLYIKEAPPGERMIKPHPDFRFVATGNTNGSGDETGLYSGTKIGNAAAYSRFGVTMQVRYPDREVEERILKSRLHLTDDLATKLVDFATSSREMYQAGELSLPISPRELLSAAKIAMLKGGKFRKGIELAYSNRLDQTQGESVSQTAQRIFGN